MFPPFHLGVGWGGVGWGWGRHFPLFAFVVASMLFCKLLVVGVSKAERKQTRRIRVIGYRMNTGQ